MGNKQGKSQLNEKDIAFLEANTAFSRSQILDWYEGFKKDCPNGKLTKKKFISVYQTFFPQGRAEIFSEHVFRTFDKDSSGKIDFVEFLVAISITSRGDPEQKLNWAFDMYDIDRSGTIDKKEMRQIVEAIYDLICETDRAGDRSPESRAAAIFAQVDSNADGLLTREEFIRGCLKDEHLCKLLTASYTGV